MGFLFTCIFVILIFVRPQEFVEGIHGWPIMDFAAVLALIAVVLDGSVKLDKLKRSPVNILMLVFWFALTSSYVAKFYLGGVWSTFLDLAPLFLVYYLMVVTVDTFTKLRAFMWLMVLMSTFLALQAIIQYYTGTGLGGGEAFQRGEEMVQAQGIGIFADPNDLAIHIVPMVAFLLPAFHRHIMSRGWTSGIIFLVPMVTGIAFTRSRGGILGLAAVFWMYMRDRVGTVLSFAGLAILFVALMAIPRMEQIDTHEESARNRLDHWTYGLSLLRENPVFGVGYQSFTDNYPKTAHNSFILVLAEAGMVGAYLWITLFYFTFRHIRLMRRVERGPPWLEPCMKALEAALLGWLVCAFFLSQTFKFLSYMLMALVVCSMNVLAREGIELEQPLRFRDMAISGAITIGGVIFMHIAIKILWAL